MLFLQHSFIFVRLTGIILFFSSWLLQPVVQAQSCKFSLLLTIKDDHSLEPLAGASVKIAATNQLWFTESNGRVTINNLCAGTYTLLVSHVGCNERQVQVVISGNTAREILLHHVKVELGEVAVVGVRPSQTEVRETLSGTRLFATRGLTLAQSLQSVNGVRMLSTGATISKPVIHGLHSNRILLVTNGVKLESQQWGTDHAPEIDPYASEKFTVIKGAASVRYGAEAIGGVVLAEPRRPRQEKGIGGEVNLAAFSNNGMGVVSGILEGATPGKTQMSWHLQGTLKKGGTTRIPGYWLANTALNEGSFSGGISLQQNQWNWDASFSYFTTRLGFYPGAHVDNLDDLNNAIASDTPLFKGNFTYAIGRPYQQTTHWIARAGAKYIWNEKHQSSFWVAHQENIREEYDARSFNPFPELSLNMGTTSAELLHNYEPASGWLWQNGINASFQQNVNQPTSARIFIRNFESYNLGAFSILKLQQGNFHHEAGLRYDYKFFESFYRQNGVLEVHTRNFSNVTANIGTRYQASPHLSFQLNLASAWRPPAPNELYANGLHQGLAAVEIGNPDFVTEKALNTNLQVQYRKDSTLHLELTVYNNYIRDFIYLQPVQPPALTINGYYPKFEYRQQDANLTGLDFFASWMAHPQLELSGKANLLYARNVAIDDWLILMPADRYELAVTWYVASGKRYTRPYIKGSATHTVEQKRVPQAKNGNELNDYAPPPPAYTLLELEAGTILTKSKIQAGLSVYNLANIRYRDYMNRFRYFADEAGLNIALRIKIPIAQH